ncbi:protein translocase subunit SecF [uncultured Umboniibacter sp.]|uniref:protein translocase subunit SecF n=1 Tax=uncultured Umboniibacter sp. TaxID=1798917 RepID=UPI002601BA9C|nr:protein translocase subunit SecF [uncultured Umboniibacter sp.]
MSEQKTIDFMSRRKWAALFSAILVVASIASIATKGLNFGLDFTGGTLLELEYEQPAELTAIREQLNGAGFAHFTVVNYGSERDVMVRMQGTGSAQLSDSVLTTLRESGEKIVLKRGEFVGPQVGNELREQGVLAMIAALAVMMVYVSVRFQYKFSVGAVAALAHDVIITVGIFSYFQWSFDLTVLAAVLAVIGYSLNDTIVVSDHIRENFRKLRSDDSAYVINYAITQTLERTVITSFTTLLVVLSLFYFGGEMIHGFASALLIGIVVGTYSSIYLSANALMSMKLSREDLLLKEKEDIDPNGVV